MPNVLQANIAVKPSLARYDLRVENESLAYEINAQGVSAAKDSDEHLLALIEHQSHIAMLNLRQGEGKKALTVLRRAFQIAEGHSSPPLPITRLAMALVKLQLCVALSQLGRHDQALGEAKGAKQETDEIWNTMRAASIEAAEADAVGITTQPAPVLRRMIRDPPSWLARVIEVAIQARQAMALEMEYEAPASGPGTGEEAASLAEVQGEEADEEEALPRGQSSYLEEMDALHAEAAELASQLLPEGHEVRECAERAHRRAQARRQARMDKVLPRTKSRVLRPHVLEPIFLPATPILRERPAPVELPEMASTLRLAGTARRKGYLATDTDVPLGQQSTQSAAEPGISESSNFSSFEELVPTVKMPNGRPTAPPGDVSFHSQPKRAISPRSSKARAASTGRLVLPETPAEFGSSGDAFKEWRQSVVFADLRLRSRLSKVMGPLLIEDDRLHDDRQLFSSDGASQARRTQKYGDDWKARTKSASDANLLDEFGFKHSRSQTRTLRDLKNIYKEAVSRSARLNLG